MQVVLTFYTPSTGWHKPLPALDSHNTLVLVFGEADASGYPVLLDELQTKYPLSIIAGCSTVAGIYNDHLMENALTIGIIKFDSSRISLSVAEVHGSTDSRRAGIQLAESLTAPTLKGVLILADGLNTNGSDLANGLMSVFDANVMVTGGLASDKMDFKSTWVLYNGAPCSHLVCGIGFYGENLFFATQAEDGWRPFGPERHITRSAGNILYEIDHHPALDLYKEYLGEHATGLPATALHFPLAIWDEDKRFYVVRTILGIDEATNSIRFAGDIPNSNQTQLMYGSFDNLVDGAESAAHSLVKKIPHPDTPVLSFAISCAGRKLVMKEDTFLELEASLDILPAGSQQIGFYSFGELAPPFGGTGCSLHNETMTLTVLYEGS